MLDGAAPLLTKGVWAGKAGKWATAGQGERPHRSPLATWTQGRASTQQDRSQQESGFPRTQLCASRPRAWLSTMAAGNSPPHAAPQVCKGLAPGPVLRESDSTELEGGDCGLVHLPGDRHGSRLRTTVSARCPARRVTRGLSQQLHGLENVTSQVRLGRWLRGHLVTRQIQVCQCEWTRGLESPPSPRVQVLPSLDSTQMVALVTPARPCSCRPALPSQAAAVACGVPPVTLKDCCPLSRGGVGVSHEQHRQQSLCTYSLPKQIEFILCKICGHF